MASRTVNKRDALQKKMPLPATMASRNQEIRPVGAWVEPGPYCGHQYQEAVVSAQYEEMKIQRTQAEKEEKLRLFQDGVRKRVQMLERLKRQQLLENSYKAVEAERNVLNQSTKAAEKSMPRKNRCLLRDDLELGIRHSALTNSQGCVINGPPRADDQNFISQSQNVREFSNQARHRLGSCKVLTEAYHPDNLPGGPWRTGPTRDHPSSRLSNVETSTDDIETVDNDSDGVPESCESTQAKVVHFDPAIDEDESQGNRITRKSAMSVLRSDKERVPNVPNIYPGVQTEEEKKLVIKQRALYRRLFMDIEREQVKENLRRKEHRKKIHELKKDKENQRRLLEEESGLICAPKDPVTGETILEMLVREQEEEVSLRREVEESEKRVKKGRETERYLDALKKQLREKVLKQGMDLPALCWCGPSVWDTDPETCANNCIFYKNPKAYGKALQSLLASCNVV